MFVRKFISEFAVNMVGGRHALLQQDDLDSEEVRAYFNEDHPCHIYMVCRRPRVTILPGDVKFTASTFEGSVTVQEGESTRKEVFSVRWPDATGLVFDSKYPYNIFGIITPDDNTSISGKVALLAPSLGDQFAKHLRAEVLYVGQSYGKEGQRTAPGRLRSHSTLQEIYAKAIAQTPDKEIWLWLWSFSPILLTSFDPTCSEYGTSIQEDDEHIERALRAGITEQQRINFTEAALIRHFRPEYNVHFAESFPNPAHKTYSECYDLDINSVAVELDTEESHCQLWSDTVSARWTHDIFYLLHSKAQRRGMFDFARRET